MIYLKSWVEKKMNINTYALHVFIYCAFVIIFFLNLGIVNDNF